VSPKIAVRKILAALALLNAVPSQTIGEPVQGGQ
jgi:hypothetical protein